jgi:hypothetical protein
MSEGMYTRRPVRPDGQFYRNQRRLRLTRKRAHGAAGGGRSLWTRAAAVCLFIALAYGGYGVFLGHHQMWVKAVGIGAAIAFMFCLAMSWLRG